MIDNKIKTALNDKILVIDGAMGTQIQSLGLSELDFRGDRFASHKNNLKGCNDVLVLTKPESIEMIHRRYKDAGADIIETNSFNANAISLADYGLEEYVGEINREAARIARKVADEKGGWVAGSIGPTNKSLSMAVSMGDESAITFDTLADTYEEQMTALLEGGVDLFLIETVFDTLNAKAALLAAERAMEKCCRKVEVIISATISDNGRILSGQSLSAFVAAVDYANPLAIGLNCGFGAEHLTVWLKELSDISNMATIFYPNAGLPNELGEYDQTPEVMAKQISAMLADGLVNIVGGCCGTTPEHIRMLAEEAKKYTPRKIYERNKSLVLSGMESLIVSRERNFVNVGERCNVAGSRKFLRLIGEKNYSEALDIARKQVEAGAQILDINMDDAMLDAEKEMVTFLNLLSAEPEIAKVPIMIDSSKPNVIKAGLKCLQGKGIVNSISLKGGKEAFVKEAKDILNMGAAVVVMAFDESGQADTYERKIEICSRAYDILTTEVGFKGHDIIFDPNVLAIATGIDEHNRYALDFIKATKWLKENLPGAKVSGGISNLSFSFRGNNYIREAMHTVFLYHAIAVGMDMAIVNAAALAPYSQIPEDVRTAIENVIFCREEDATEKLIALASQTKDKKTSDIAISTDREESLSNDDKIIKMLVKGRGDLIETLLAVAVKEYITAVEIIEGPLMAGMNEVGRLFANGELFLPQVVKSAKIMKDAVSYLQPLMEKEEASGQNYSGKIIMATVKGDVHDIGKNIVDVVLRCNGFNVIDLGVMVPADVIIDRAIEEKADIIGLSGLITPSLDEMCSVARLAEERGLSIPLMVGGATASAVHTAVKIAPEYSGIVAYTRDAAEMTSVAHRLLDADGIADEIKSEQNLLRQEYFSGKDSQSVTFAEAIGRKHKIDWENYKPVEPQFVGEREMAINISTVVDYINWRAFFPVWNLDASFAELAEIKGCGHCQAQWIAAQKPERIAATMQAMDLLKDARAAIARLVREAGDSISAKIAFRKAKSVGDDSISFEVGGNDIVLPVLRQQYVNAKGECWSLADFVSPSSDYVGAFAITIGAKIAQIVESYKEKDEFKFLLYQSLADRLVEASAEYLHKAVREQYWGYDRTDLAVSDTLTEKYVGIRPAAGYPSLPDQSSVFVINEVLGGTKELGMQITENGALKPASSVMGLYISHADSRYFILKKICDDQRKRYAEQKGISMEELERWLPK